MLPDEPSLAVRSNFECRRASHRIGVEREGSRTVVGLETVAEDSRTGRRAAWRAWTERAAGLSVFVVADQQDVAVGPGNAAIPSIAFGVGNPSSIGSPSLLITRVLEACRQRQVFAGRPQRTIADAVTSPMLTGERRSSDEGIEESRAERRGSRSDSGAGKELTAIERGPFRTHTATSDSPAA